MVNERKNYILLINKKQAFSKQGSVCAECTVIHLTYEPTLLVLHKVLIIYLFTIFFFFWTYVKGGGGNLNHLYTS